MPAVSGVWSCLHYPVPRGGFSPPGLGCFLVCARLTVNPKCTGETIAVTSPPQLSSPTMLYPPPLKWILSGGGSQDTPDTFLQSLFPFHLLLLPLPLFSSISEYQQGLRQHECHAVGCPAGCTALVTQLFGISCARETVPTHTLCRSLQTTSLQALHYFYQRENPINLICLLGNYRLQCT